MKKTQIYFFLILAGILLFFGNSSLAITDSVESNYALTAKEMVLSGDWLSPQIYGKYWFDKPVMFYWLTALSFKIFGFTEFAARFFPAVFGLSGLALVYWAGKKLYCDEVGLYSSIILLSSLEFFLISKSVITDAVLFFFFSGCLLFFYLGYSRQKAYYWYLMYVCAGMATLTKGPVGFLLPGLIIVIFLGVTKKWRIITQAKLGTGILLFLAVVLPWYGMMYKIHGADFLNVFFGTHNFLRATVSEHSRDNVIYYYTLVNLLALLPWSLLLPAVIYQKYQNSSFKLQERELFLVIWAAVIFVFFQSVATKYITYTYPLLFPAALLLGSYLYEHQELLQSKKYNILIFSVYGLLTLAAWKLAENGIVSGQMLYIIPASILLGAAVYGVYFAEQRMYLQGIGFFSILFYLALIYCIAMPFSMQRSAKNVSYLLKNYCAETEIGVYNSYPTSAVFYSDKKLVKLISAGEVESFKPKAYSWSSKNVMPYAELENAIYDKVLVKIRDKDKFLQADKHHWEEKYRTNKWLILKRRDEN